MPRIDIGIDAGGTTTRLKAQTAAGEGFSAEASGSNPRVIGANGTIGVFRELIRRACGDHLAGAEVFLCAGVAGASTADIQQEISAGILASLADVGSKSVKITDDATTSFEAAFSGRPGTLLLLGTGSNIVCKTFDGRWVYSGGWGYLIGDEGSGYAIGRLGLRAVARAIDRGLSTRLSARAAADHGLDSRASFLAAVYGGSLRLASFAQVVLDEASCGDIESKLLISRAVGTLTDDLASTVEGIASDLPKVIRVVGGLASSSIYMSELGEGIAIRLGEQWHIEPSERSPLEGALWMASRMTD